MLLRITAKEYWDGRGQVAEGGLQMVPGLVSKLVSRLLAVQLAFPNSNFPRGQTDTSPLGTQLPRLSSTSAEPLALLKTLACLWNGKKCEKKFRNRLSCPPQLRDDL